MKIKTFNHSNCGGKKTNEPTIGISPIGAMRLNKEATELLTTSKTLMVEFAQSDDRPKDWYIFESNSVDAFQAREYQKGLIVQNAFVARAILKSVGGGKESISFRIGKTPEQEGKKCLYPIITANPIKVLNNRKKI